MGDEDTARRFHLVLVVIGLGLAAAGLVALVAYHEGSFVATVMAVVLALGIGSVAALLLGTLRR